MSLRLEELRKRLLQQPEHGTEASSSAAPANGASLRDAPTPASVSATPPPPSFKDVPVAAQAAAAEPVVMPMSCVAIPLAASAQSMAAGPTVESEAAVTQATDNAPRPVLGYAELARAKAASAAAAKIAEAANSGSAIATATNGAAMNNGSSVTNGAAITTRDGNSAKPAPAVQQDLTQAVAKVFEQSRMFRDRLDELTRTFKTIEQIGESATKAFVPLQSFRAQMVQLARSFEPMRVFQAQLAQMAQTFEPMKALEQQLSQLADAFQEQLGQVVTALEPARQFRERVMDLARSFESAADLQEEFSRLHNALRAASVEPSLRVDSVGEAAADVVR